MDNFNVSGKAGEDHNRDVRKKEVVMLGIQVLHRVIFYPVPKLAGNFITTCLRYFPRPTKNTIYNSNQFGRLQGRTKMRFFLIRYLIYIGDACFL